MKEKIRPIYNELQGYLSQAPKNNLTSNEIWEQTNETIDELNKITETNEYEKFKIKSFTNNWQPSEQIVDISSYKQKLAGLINRLHGQFFNNEASPSNSSHGTSINVTQ